MIKFTVPGEPKGKGRPRATKTGVMYTPKDTASYENWIKCCFQMAAQERIDGNVPLQANINALYGIPKSATKKERQSMIDGGIVPTKKPDCDNIIKIILDSLNGMAYDDDKQVVSVRFNKVYTDGEPKVCVQIVPFVKIAIDY